jgi:hypothetical protein
MINDIGADKGLMISENGYTESALKRAHYNPHHIELDIYSLGEVVSQFQGFGAIPYSGGYGTILTAPFGWIIDASKRPGVVCSLYQKGLSFDEAVKEKEFAYINFGIKEDISFTINHLLKIQNDKLVQDGNVNSIKHLSSIQRDDATTIIRIADIKNYPGLELTGLLEFEKFIFFCVWFSKEVNLKRNIRKLESIMSSIIPVKLTTK